MSLLNNKHKTNRGFDIIEFKDRYDTDCSIQESSIDNDEACIWLGISKPEPKICVQNEGWVPVKVPEGTFINGRMHITQSMAGELAVILQHFSETGELKTYSELCNDKLTDEQVEYLINTML